MKWGTFPKPPFKARAVSELRWFLNAQLFEDALLSQQQLNVLVMGRRLKYSVQQKAFSAGVVASPGTTLQPLVPATTLEGMRKVKHLMVNMAPVPDNAGPIYWAIVYVPQGTTQAFSTSTQQQWQTCMNPTSSS